MPEKTTKKTPAVKEEKVKKPVVHATPAPATVKVQAPVIAEEKFDAEDGLTDADFIIPEKDLKSDRFYEAIGRRKTAIARVRLYTKGEKQLIINDKPFKQYFQSAEGQALASDSLRKMKCLDRFRITAIVRGGGEHAQAEAVRHGIARVLVDFNPNFRKRLRKAGYLTRDPRM